MTRPATGGRRGGRTRKRQRLRAALLGELLRTALRLLASGRGVLPRPAGAGWAPATTGVTTTRSGATPRPRVTRTTSGCSPFPRAGWSGSPAVGLSRGRVRRAVVGAPPRRGDAAVLAVAAVAVSVYFFIHASFDWLEEFPALAVPAFASRSSRWWPPPRRWIRPVPRHGARQARRSRRRDRDCGNCGRRLAIQYLALRYFERAGRLGASDRPLLSGPRPSGGPQPALGPAASQGRRPCGQGRRPGAGSGGLRQGARHRGSWYAHLELALLDSQVGRFRSADRQLELATRLNASDEFLAEAAVASAAESASIRRHSTTRFRSA